MQVHPIPSHHLFIDLTGKTFGKWIVLSYAGMHDGDYAKFWNCLCQGCGAEREVSGNALKQGSTSSCRKCQRRVPPTPTVKHGMTGTPEYTAWSAMKDRCYRDKNCWHNYGGRGIVVCKEWLGSFQAFFDHVGKKPSKEHQLDRINNDGNYEPGNVRWVLPVQNHRNKRTNRLLIVDGVSKTATEWCEQYGIHPNTLWKRLESGMDHASAVKTPVDKKYSHGRKPKPIASSLPVLDFRP